MLMNINIGIEKNNRVAVVKILNVLLCDEYLLYTKTLNYHWNVVGPDFAEYHKFLEKQYEALLEIVDEVAERARSLGGIAFGTLAEFAENSRLKETPGKLPDSTGMMRVLCEDHEAIIRFLREDQELVLDKYQDAGTNNFLIDLMERHEKMAWMLRAFGN